MTSPRQGLSAGPDDALAWTPIGSLLQQGQIPAARAALARQRPEPDTEGRARLWTDLHRGVQASQAEARAMVTVAKRQPAGPCRAALAGMLQREMTLAAKAGQSWPGDLVTEVTCLADPGQLQATPNSSQERETAPKAAVTSVQAGRLPQVRIATATGQF